MRVIVLAQIIPVICRATSASVRGPATRSIRTTMPVGLPIALGGESRSSTRDGLDSEEKFSTVSVSLEGEGGKK